MSWAIYSVFGSVMVIIGKWKKQYRAWILPFSYYPILSLMRHYYRLIIAEYLQSENHKNRLLEAIKNVQGRQNLVEVNLE